MQGCSGDGSRPVAVWRRTLRAQPKPGRTRLGLVCPGGALRARWARPNLIGTGVSCGRVRSTTTFGGGGSSLPRGRGPADPDSGYSSQSLADLVVHASVRRRRWRLCDRGGACWWAERLVASRNRSRGAPMLRSSRGSGLGFSGEILISVPNTDAVPPLCGISPS